MTQYQLERENRTQWFRDSRFGMFLHWGLYSIPARNRSEWYRSIAELPAEEYEPLFDEFNPDCCDPTVWAKQAKMAGMKYAVLTAKHHDGFCLFDSNFTDFKSTILPVTVISSGNLWKRSAPRG